MNGDFHFFGTGTAAIAAGLDSTSVKIVANAAEFVDYFIGDYYWSYWKIVKDDSWWPSNLFTIDYPQLTAQSAAASFIQYYSDYWIAFHFPPGNQKPIKRQFTGEMQKLQERYLQKFVERNVNLNVKNKACLCRPYSQFIIDMIDDTVQTYQRILKEPNWQNFVKSKISQVRYVSNSIPRDKLALIFLGIRMHILADSWAHQDFTGFNDKSINHVDGDVYADVYTTGKMEKAPFNALSGPAASFFTGGMIGELDTDVSFAPLSGCGHGNLGHYPDYGWLNIDYPAAWRPHSAKIHRDNPTEYIEAWKEIATVIAMCLNNSTSNIQMPNNVETDIRTRFDLSSTSTSAPNECEKLWARDAGLSLRDTVRWKDKVSDPCIGVTHGLAKTRWGSVWIKDGSILHMYELAALMHFSWCQTWTSSNPGYGWLASTQPKDSSHYWGFEEKEGSVALDSIGRVNATLQPSVTRETPGWNSPQAIHIDGSDDSYVSFGSQVGQFGTSDFTVCFWMKTSETIRFFDLVGNRTAPSHGNFFCIRMTGIHESMPKGCITVEIAENSNGKNYIQLVGKNRAGLNDGRWHHVAAIRQGTSLKLFVDGTVISQATGSGIANINNGNEFRIGRSLKMNVNRFAPNASFDGLYVAEKALTENEIRKMFYEDTIHLWTFDEKDGAIVYDSIGDINGVMSKTAKRETPGLNSAGAIHIDGSDGSYVSLGSQVGQFRTSDFTVCFWMKTSETIRLFDLVGNRTAPSHGNFLCIRMTGIHESLPKGCITVEIDENSNGKNYIQIVGKSRAGLNDDRWHHVAAIRQGTSLKLFVDGTMISQATGSGIANINNENDFRIGRSLKMNINRFAPNASFDGLFVFKRAISDTEVNDIYTNKIDILQPL